MSRKWLRVVAALLLLFAFADLSVPGVCQTDDPLPGQIAPSFGNCQMGGNSAFQGNPGDDCFCCCTHIVPTSHFELVIGVCVTPEVRSTGQGQVKIFHSPVYHPPRG